MNRKTVRILALAAVTLAAVTLVVPPLAHAADPSEIDRRVQALSENVMSPFCPGRTVSSCPSPQARELRTQIHSWVEAGYTDEAVRNQLLMIYGEDVRGAPQSEGFGLVGWLAPAAFVLLGGVIMILKLNRLKNAAAAAAGNAAPEVSPILQQRIERALRARE